MVFYSYLLSGKWKILCLQFSWVILIRIELYSSGNRIISPENQNFYNIIKRNDVRKNDTENQNFYNISITLHGFLMIFFLVMPGLFGGFGNYFYER